MKTTKFVIGIILTSFSGFFLLVFLVTLSTGILQYEETFLYIIYSILALIVGIALITSSNNDIDKQEYEEFKRMKEQERAIYYRYANAKGTPIQEYMMDDRTKLITYYDRMPEKYKRQLLERADTLYRRSENEKYLNQSK